MFPLLEGLRIVDLTAVVLGPYATQILGDLGAEVIKVESPEGDSMRTIAPLAEPGLSAIYVNNNRNKYSVVLDLKTAGGKAALAKLVATADAFVHNMRQDALDKLGFGYDAVIAINPRICYCAGVGFGQAGPYAGMPAYDDVIQAASGFAGLFGMRDGTPVYAPSIIADKVTGLHLAYATLAALLYRERTGRVPGYVEVPMLEAMAAFNLNEHLADASFADAGRIGYARVLAPDRRPYATKDGWIGVLPYSEAKWRAVLAEIGRPEVTKEPWFPDATERSKRVGDLYAVLGDALARRTTADWKATFLRLDVPHAEVRTPNDLLADPHLLAVGTFTPNFSGATPVKRTLRAAPSFAAVARAKDRAPPRLGADTQEVLARAGCSAEEIRAAMVPKR